MNELAFHFSPYVLIKNEKRDMIWRAIVPFPFYSKYESQTTPLLRFLVKITIIQTNIKVKRSN